VTGVASVAGGPGTTTCVTTFEFPPPAGVAVTGNSIGAGKLGFCLSTTKGAVTVSTGVSGDFVDITATDGGFLVASTPAGLVATTTGAAFRPALASGTCGGLLGATLGAGFLLDTGGLMGRGVVAGFTWATAGTTASLLTTTGGVDADLLGTDGVTTFTGSREVVVNTTRARSDCSTVLAGGRTTAGCGAGAGAGFTSVTTSASFFRRSFTFFFFSLESFCGSNNGSGFFSNRVLVTSPLGAGGAVADGAGSGTVVTFGGSSGAGPAGAG
jgi:hypothetical protein